MSDEATKRMLQVLEFINDPANWEWHLAGIEDYHYRMENGERVFLGSADWERDAGGYRFGLQPDLYGNPQSFKENSEYQIELARADGDTTRAEIIAMIVSMVEGYEEDDVRAIAGQFIPAGIYEGYPDIATHKMYQEYAARIIVGDWDIDRFDEFVDRWYEQGGEEVTERAQEVYQAD
jgi:putative aldouronate transport system substrate-binding protein